MENHTSILAKPRPAWGFCFLKKCISLTKPGIIFGNAITFAGGFFLGSKGHIHFFLLLAALIGMALVIASGCVLNNYIDRDIDRLMERTKNRVLAKGLMPYWIAIVYGIVLGVAGLLLLYFGANPLCAYIALFGVFIYVGVYSLYAKRHSNFGTLIGAIAGAVPPVIGYSAATGSFDTASVILFSILFFWQIPHSYSIGIYRLRDYAAASIPILPVRKSIYLTKIRMLLYIVGFIISATMLTVFRYTGFLYLILTLCIGAAWLYLSAKGFSTTDDNRWSRRMFAVSIINIMLLSAMMAVGV